MHTPSGRFQPSTRLCLSISDFHPKSFNPAWEVSTILIGLLSFMTSEEMTTGSIAGTETERRWAATKSRWWNSTGGGSAQISTQASNARGAGAIKAGDGGVKFRFEFPELDAENRKWMAEVKQDLVTGEIPPKETTANCAGDAALLRKRPVGSAPPVAAVVEQGQVARDMGQGWLRRNKATAVFFVMIAYVLVSRLIQQVSL
jgi:ubiquitin-conjugating enzyme E2 J2